MTTVAVVACCTPDYEGWLDGWLRSVAGLARAPDLVAVVAEQGAPLPAWVTRVDPPGPWRGFAGWHDAALAAAEGCDYAAWIGVDDRYRPCALDGCDDWDADVVAFGMDLGDGRTWTPEPTTGTVLHGPNAVPAGSPVRVDAWQRVRFDPAHEPWTDWGMWVALAATGATFSHTGRIDFDYRYHPATALPGGDAAAAIAATRDRLLGGSA